MITNTVLSIFFAAISVLLLLRSRRLLSESAPYASERWFAWIAFPLLLNVAAWLLFRLYPPVLAALLLLAAIFVGSISRKPLRAALLAASLYPLFWWPYGVMLLVLPAGWSYLFWAMTGTAAGAAPRRWRAGTYSAAAFLATAVLAIEAMLSPVTARWLFPYANPGFCILLLGKKRVLTTLIAGLKYPNVDYHAISALPSLGDAAVPALLAALTDRDERVRAGAALTMLTWAPGEMNDARIVPALIAALGDDSESVRKNAALTLMARSDARDALAEAVKRGKGRLRREAAWLLGEMGDRRAMPALREAL